MARLFVWRVKIPIFFVYKFLRESLMKNFRICQFLTIFLTLSKKHTNVLFGNSN